MTQVSRSEPKASEDHQVGRPVVLLVDDEPRILSALVRALRREGYRLLVAEAPGDALRLVEQNAIDCVLSDYKMPGMTGLELIERVTRIRPHAARLVITGWNTEIDPRELTRLGVRRVLSKPWEDAELKRTLRAALESAGCRVSPG